MNSILRNLLIGAGALIAAVVIFRRSDEQKAEDVLLGFTEETGVVGTLGAAANRASGGALADFGSAIGTFFSGKFFDRRTVDDLTGGPVGDRPTTQPVDFVGPPI